MFAAADEAGGVGSEWLNDPSELIDACLAGRAEPRIGGIGNDRTDLRCRRTGELGDLIEGHAEPARMSPNNMTGNTRATAQNV